MSSNNNLISKIKKITIIKIKHRLWFFFVLGVFRNTWIYPLLYKSYWHFLLCSKINNQKKIQKNYLSVNVISVGAGIGHQLTNYNADLWYAKKFNLIHVHTPFPNKKWEKILGFNFSSISSKKLLGEGYKKIKLPQFIEKNSLEIYTGKGLISILELQQEGKKSLPVEQFLRGVNIGESDLFC